MKKISVVIPCRNEVLYIEECITAIYNSTDFERWNINVYIVDGMSDDGTREKIKSLIKQFDNLYLVDNKRQLTPFAFNLGIYAGGKVDYVQIIGARHIVSKNYISNCVKKLESDNDTWCVGGKIVNEYINHLGEVFSNVMATTFGMGIGNFRTLNKSGYTDTVTSPMYPYWVFEKIGFFDEDLIRNQDDDFNYRVTKAGGKIFFDADISLRYYVRGNYSGLRRQFFQYGYWKVFVNKKHQSVTTFRQLVPPLFVLYSIVFPLFYLINLKLGFLASIPLVMYLFLNVFFSSINWKGLKAFVERFTAYLILHYSYGFGYLRGIIDFLILKKVPSIKQKRLSR